MTERVAPAVPTRVFVTGGAGFIGRALIGRLRELGADAGGVDLHADPTIGVVAGSTTDPSAWVQHLHGVDTIIHTAAIVSNVASHDAAWRVNVLGTRRTIAAAAAAGVGRFIHLSSIMAYGFDYPDGVDETYPVRVNGYSYTDSRVSSEAVVMTAHAAGEVDATVVRPGDVIGPGSIWVREPIERARSGQLVLPAGGSGVLTPIYLDNLVDAILLTLSTPTASGQVLTLTDGYGVPCHDYFGRLAGLAGGRARTLPTPVAIAVSRGAGALLRRLGQRNELSAATMLMLARTGVYSNEKARRLLGFEPLVGYDEAMSRIEVWARDEGLI